MFEPRHFTIGVVIVRSRWHRCSERSRDRNQEVPDQLGCPPRTPPLNIRTQRDIPRWRRSGSRNFFEIEIAITPD